MKKVFFVLLVLLILVIGATFLAVLYTGPTVKRGIERVGPALTGTVVEIDDVQVSYRRGLVTVENFRVKNPEGYEHPDAIRADFLLIEADLWSLFGGVIDVKELTLVNPHITYERKLRGSNLEEIQKHLSEVLGRTEDEEPLEEEKAAGKDVIFRRVHIEGATVQVAGAGREATHTIEPIHLENVGSRSDPVTLASASATIFRAVLGSAADDVFDFGTELLREGVDEARDFLREL